MTLEHLSYLSQTIAAVAVVVSLIYLAVQVRQTERNQRAMMQQARTDRGILLSTLLTEPHMAVMIAKVSQDAQVLSPQEAVQLNGLVRSVALNLLDARGLHAMKLLSDEAFERARVSAGSFLASPLARAAWSVTRAQFPPADAAAVDAMAVTAVPIRSFDFAVAIQQAHAALKQGPTP